MERRKRLRRSRDEAPGKADTIYSICSVSTLFTSISTTKGPFPMISSIRRSLLVFLILALGAGGCATSATAPAVIADDARKPALAFIEALSNADMDALLALFRDDATVFMPFSTNPERASGKKEIRAAFAPMFERLRASGRPAPYMQLNPRDLETQVYGSTAIITFHLGTLPVAGATEPSSFSRRTVIVTRDGERWLIAHLHASNMRVDPPKTP